MIGNPGGSSLDRARDASRRACHDRAEAQAAALAPIIAELRAAGVRSCARLAVSQRRWREP